MSVENVERLKEELSQVEGQAERLRLAIAVLEGDPAAVDGRLRSGEYADFGIVIAAKRWLKEIGRPQTTSEIKDALIRRGWTTTSKNPTATIYATLDNSPDFVRDKKTGVWQLRTTTEGGGE